MASRTPVTTTVTRVSITEDAPVQAHARARRREPPRTVAWWWLVAASLLVLVLVGRRRCASGGRVTRETRTTSYRVLGDLAGVRLDLGDADVEIDGGATAVEVRRVDRFAFGQPSDERRTVENGTLSVISRCPDQVLGSCRASYRLAVPDNVPLDIETSSGTVSLTGVRASVAGHHRLGRRSPPPASAASRCARARTPATSRALGVLGRPARAALAQRRRARRRPGRPLPDRRAERHRARSASAGSTTVDDAPFQIQALSTSGDVTVEAAS